MKGAIPTIVTTPTSKRNYMASKLCNPSPFPCLAGVAPWGFTRGVSHQLSPAPDMTWHGMGFVDRGVSRHITTSRGGLVVAWTGKLELFADVMTDDLCDEAGEAPAR